MRAYLDANVLIALFANDPFTARARSFLITRKPVLLVSDFACAEFASGIARHVRMEMLPAGDAQAFFSASTLGLHGHRNV